MSDAWAAARFSGPAFDALPVAAMLVSADRTIVEVNRRFVALTGWTTEHIVGRPTTVLRGPDTAWSTSAALSDSLAAGEDWNGEILTYRADGTAFWDLVSFRRLEVDEGPWFIGTMVDITDLVRLRRSNEERGGAAAVLLELAGRLGVSMDRPAVARTVASAVARLGAERAAVAIAEGTGFRVLGTAGWAMGPDGLEGMELALDPSQLEAPIGASSIAGLPGADRTAVWLAPLVRDDEILGVLIADRSDGHPDLSDRLIRAAGLAATALDNLAALDEFREAAERDPLTGLLTHRALVRRFAGELDRARRTRFVGAVHLDLDHFRRVNEAFGYGVGDRLLQIVADRLRDEVGSGVLIARHGSDEFMLAVSRLEGPEELEPIVERLDRAVRRPVTLDGNLVYPIASFGRTVRRRGQQPSAALAASLLRAADLGMHGEKDRRRSRTAAAEPFAVLELDAALHRAVEAGELVAHFQPQYCVTTGELCGFEVLARWTHPEYGPISPDVFIALAEDNGLIQELGRQMLEHGRRFLAARQDGGTIAVNVSTKQLAVRGFARLVADVFDDDPRLLARVVVEVTESSLIVDHDLVLHELGELRRLGVGVSVDDFGSGYSSLFQLQELPVTELKIDRAFVQRGGVVGTSVLQAIVRLARSLDLRIVAEGVETQEQLDMLRELGCDCVQGFFLAPALPEDLASALGPRRPTFTES